MRAVASMGVCACSPSYFSCSFPLTSDRVKNHKFHQIRGNAKDYEFHRVGVQSPKEATLLSQEP